jgi:hypothetical protein
MQHLPLGLLRQQPIRGTCSLLSLSQLLKLKKMDLQVLPFSSSL